MLFSRLQEQIQSLCDLLSQLTDEQYNKKIFHLGNASIGGHTRHIIELLQCVTVGYHTGKIDYENRIRNIELETIKSIALDSIRELIEKINLPDKALLLAEGHNHSCQVNGIATTYYREVVYITEHTIHHLALIAVALKELNLNVTDSYFGMAYATIKFKQETESQSR